MLQPGSMPEFPVYVRDPDGAFELFQSAGEPVYLNTWQKLDQAGAELVYIDGADEEACLAYVEEHLAEIVGAGDVPVGEAAEWAYRVACRALKRLLREPESADAAGRVRDVMETVAAFVSGEPDTQWRMLDGGPLNYHVHTHSVNVALLMLGFARRVLGIHERDALVQVALGGAMHDLGKALLPADILHKPGALTRREFAEVAKHPRYGLLIAQPYVRRGGVAQRIIAQHHEDACGEGYPSGCAGESIHSLARVARLADSFDALTSHRSYAEARDVREALAVMVGEMSDRFDPPLLRRFVRYMAARSGHDTPAQVATPTGRRANDPELWLPATKTAPAIAPVQTQREDLAAGARAAAARPDGPLEPVSRLDSFSGLGAGADDGLMMGVVRALQGAVAEWASDNAPTGTDRQDASGWVTRQDRREQVDPVRALFPLVWQVDGWTARFRERPAATPEARAMREETLRCMASLRESLSEALHNHGVEIVDTPGAASDGAPARAGFVHHTAQGAEMLEPPGPDGDLRRAG